MCGIEHLGVRLAVAAGHLSPDCLRPGDGWPDLYPGYDEMAAAMAGDGTDE